MNNTMSILLTAVKISARASKVLSEGKGFGMSTCALVLRQSKQ